MIPIDFDKNSGLQHLLKELKICVTTGLFVQRSVMRRLNMQG